MKRTATYTSIVVIMLALAPAMSRADDAGSADSIPTGSASASTASSEAADVATLDYDAKAQKTAKAAHAKARKKKKAGDFNPDPSWIHEASVEPEVTPDPSPSPDPEPVVQAIPDSPQPAVVVDLPPAEPVHETATCRNPDFVKSENAPIDLTKLATIVATPARVATADIDSLVRRVKYASCPSSTSVDDASDSYQIREKIVERLSRNATAEERRAMEDNSEVVAALDDRAEACAHRYHHSSDSDDSGISASASVSATSRSGSGGWGWSGLNLGLYGYMGLPAMSLYAGMSPLSMMAYTGMPYMNPYAMYGSASIYSGMNTGLYSGLYGGLYAGLYPGYAGGANTYVPYPSFGHICGCTGFLGAGAGAGFSGGFTPGYPGGFAPMPGMMGPGGNRTF